MKKVLVVLLVSYLFFPLLSACGKQPQDLVDMTSTNIDGKRAVVWEDRTYAIFCVVSKKDCSEQIGYVDKNIKWYYVDASLRVLMSLWI